MLTVQEVHDQMGKTAKVLEELSTMLDTTVAPVLRFAKTIQEEERKKVMLACAQTLCRHCANNIPVEETATGGRGHYLSRQGRTAMCEAEMIWLDAPKRLEEVSHE